MSGETIRDDDTASAPTIRDSPSPSIPTIREDEILVNATKSAPTTLEQTTAESAPTALEQQQPNATTLENPAAEQVRNDPTLGNRPSRSRINFPFAIEERYEWLFDNPKPGSEADSAILRDRTTGREVFFKYYRKNTRPKIGTIERLRQANG